MPRPALRPVSWVLLTLASLGCSSGGSPADRGGPHSLVGFRWEGPVQTVAGLTFAPEFSFGPSSVTARNTCNGTLSVETTAPAGYRYTATIPSGGRRDETSDGSSCFVEILAGSFDFALEGDSLRVTRGGETSTFQPASGIAGIYGTWFAEAEGVGRLEWTMGGGRIRASHRCTNGLVAMVEVGAAFTNVLDITADSANMAEEGGLTCDVRIARGTYTYVFDGMDMLLTGDGGTVRFIPTPR